MQHAAASRASHPGRILHSAADIVSAFPGTTFQFTNTLTSPFFSSVNAVILGVATSDTSSITPLSASEQSALKSFVLGGGIALMFSDNDTFARTHQLQMRIFWRHSV